MSESTIKPEHVKRQRTRSEYESDRRFNRNLLIGCLAFIAAAFAAMIWVFVAYYESTPDQKPDHVPTEMIWNGRR